MFTGPVGPVEVFFYWPEAVFGIFYWPGAIGSPLASSPGPAEILGSHRRIQGSPGHPAPLNFEPCNICDSLQCEIMQIFLVLSINLLCLSMSPVG